MLPGPLRPSSPMLRTLAGVVALTLVTSVNAAAANAPLPGTSLQMRAVGPETPESEIERLYVEGQDKYGNGDFSAAADAWTRLLERLPEAQANKATRENVLLNIVQADLDAYNRTRKDDGSKDIEHLRSGKKILDRYYTDYRRAYGDRASVSVAVQEKGDELERLLEQAEKEAASAAATTTTTTGDPTTTDPGKTDPGTGNTGNGNTKEVIVLKPQSAGSGLIVGGAIAGAVGVGMLGLGIAGGVLGPRAEDEFNEADDQAGRDAATVKGDRANALMISGLVVGIVGLGAGAALIVLGVKRRRDVDAAAKGAVSFAPVLGRQLSGVALSGRF